MVPLVVTYHVDELQTLPCQSSGLYFGSKTGWKRLYLGNRPDKNLNAYLDGSLFVPLCVPFFWDFIFLADEYKVSFPAFSS